MDKKEIVNYWASASNSDFQLALILFENERYPYSLFFLHLSIEKLLKGLIVSNTSNPAPYGHNLVRLVETADIECSEEQRDLLRDITTFNISGRYDDYKNQFYRTATKEYAEKYIKQAKHLTLWLKKHFQTI
ncbi:MAG TPA: HEPN domain-containing protein [Candidatus Paceibacterota bacterium]